MPTVTLAGGHVNDGPAWYRIEIPATWLRSRGHDVLTVYNDLDESKGHLEGCKTFLTQRGWHPMLVLALEVMHRRGLRVVYELDDDIWNIPQWNPLGRFFTDQVKNGMSNCIRLSDEVVVTTPNLAREVSRFNPNVRVVRNAIPFSSLQDIPQPKHTGIRIGWAGSGTHSQDLQQALPALLKLLHDRKDVTLVFMGSLPVGIKPGPRIEFHRWVTPTALYGTLKGLCWDVALAPLAAHQFNESKSDVKILEAAACAVPVIASNVGPYQVVNHGVTGIKVENTTKAWEEALFFAAENTGWCSNAGRAARLWAEQYASLDAIGPQWESALGLSEV